MKKKKNTQKKYKSQNSKLSLFLQMPINNKSIMKLVYRQMAITQKEWPRQTAPINDLTWPIIQRENYI